MSENSLFGLEALAALGLLAALWQAFMTRRDFLTQHKNAKFPTVAWLTSSSISVLSLQFLLYVLGHGINPWLLRLSIITWTAAVVIMLRVIGPSALLRRLAELVLGVAALAIALRPTQAGEVLARLDSFYAEVLGLQGGVAGESKPGFSLSDLLRAAYYFVNFFVFSFYFGQMLSIRRAARKRAASEIDGLEANAAKQLILMVSLAIALWISFVLLGQDALSVGLFSGLVLAGLSIALQDLVKDFVDGVLLVWEGSIRAKDVIALDASRIGQIESLGLRHLIVRDRNDISYIVPYSDLATSRIENWTRGARVVRLKLDLEIAYGSNVDKAKELIREACFETPRVLHSPLPVVLITGLGESGLRLQVRFRIDKPEDGVRNVMSDLYERILEGFTRGNIEIPYPQLEVRRRLPDREDALDSAPLVLLGNARSK